MTPPAHSLAGYSQSAGWEIGVRRTVNLSQAETWQLVTSPAGLRCWLGEPQGRAFAPGTAYQLPDGTRGELRVLSLSHLRMTWQPPGWDSPSTIQVRALASAGRAVLAFHQERLPGPDAREERRVFFHHALDALEALIAGSP